MTDRSRRDFLRTAGIGAAASFTAGAGALSTAIARAEDAEGKEAKFTLGMASYTLRKFPLEEALVMTGKMQLDQICLKSFHLPMDASDAQCAAVAAQCADAGISAYGCGVCYMRSEEDVENTFRYAKAAGMTTIVGVAAPALLPAVDAKVKETGITLAIHNHGPGDKVYPTAKSIYEAVQNYDPRIGLCIDIGHSERIGENPADAIRKYADRVLDMHLKDVTEASKSGRCCICGQGVIDLVAVVRALIAIDYGRIASFEYEADANDPLPGCAQAVGYIRGVTAAVS